MFCLQNGNNAVCYKVRSYSMLRSKWTMSAIEHCDVNSIVWYLFGNKHGNLKRLSHPIGLNYSKSQTFMSEDNFYNLVGAKLKYRTGKSGLSFG